MGRIKVEVYVPESWVASDELPDCVSFENTIILLVVATEEPRVSVILVFVPPPVPVIVVDPLCTVVPSPISTANHDMSTVWLFPLRVKLRVEEFE